MNGRLLLNSPCLELTFSHFSADSSAPYTIFVHRELLSLFFEMETGKQIGLQTLHISIGFNPPVGV
jgi:hypothetical protein